MPKPHLMGELKSRILPLFRRSSGSGSSQKSTATDSFHSDGQKTRSKVSLLSRAKPSSITEPVLEEVSFSPSIPSSTGRLEQQSIERPPTPPKSPFPTVNDALENPRLTVEEPTPDQPRIDVAETSASDAKSLPVGEASLQRQSLTLGSQRAFINNLLQSHSGVATQVEPQDYFSAAPVLSPSMLHRKIWVRRPGASATLVQLNEEDLVDDARDKILRKYGNSLGRTFDSPDVTLRIIPRPTSHGVAERVLGPEEMITRTLDLYFPDGQSVDEALVIDVPHRRTPRHSPRVYAEHRPPENGGDYFSVMPVPVNHSPHLPSNISVTGSAGSGPQIHAMSIINTGHVAPLPSPGGTRRHVGHRPKVGRTTTSSPTILTSNPPHLDNRPGPSGTPSAPPLPTPPLPTVIQPKVATPPARVSSPRPSKNSKPKRAKKAPVNQLPPTTSLLEGGVPPINVLIVEDNMINLRLLEAFMKRLKVRWHTAMNGREAVNKWRAGGFHLVLMDIQLPVMNGLDATKEIRRLESENGIGVLAAKVGDTDSVKEDNEDLLNPQGDDKLENRETFKSPVIIVALTASNLQSDRHEALAAGCNDFLTKPVNFVWLERKVMEWGCMQALIDFDGWRKWKHFSQSSPNSSKGTNILTAGQSTGTGSASSPVSANRNKKSTNQSDSTGSSDSTSNHNGISPPDTLTALNAQHSESVDTLESVSTTDSVISTETAAPMSSAATLTPAGNFSRQSSSQSGKQIPQPHSSTNLSPKLQPISSKHQIQNKPAMQPQDERRRKRSSLGRSGLSGVVEEMEDGKGVGVGA